MQDASDVLDSVQAAALLKVARATLLAACRAGNVPCVRVGHKWRFSRRALLAWLAGETTPAPEPAPEPAAPRGKGRPRALKQATLEGV